MKKISLLILTAITAITSQMHANCCYNPFCGWYIGENIGLAMNMGDVSFTSNFDELAGEVNATRLQVDSSCNSYSNKLWGELFVGWGATRFNCLYLGAQGGVNFSSFKESSKLHTRLLVIGGEDGIAVGNQEVLLTSKLRDIEYFIDGKIGWLWCQNTLPYFLVGVAFNQPKLNADPTTEILLVQEPPPNALLMLSPSTSTKGKKSHFRWGLGIEHMISSCLSIHSQYLYTNYGTVEIDLDELTDDGDSLALVYKLHGKARLRRQILSVGLSYHF